MTKYYEQKVFVQLGFELIAPLSLKLSMRGLFVYFSPTPHLSHVVSSLVLANSRPSQDGPQGQRDDGGRKDDNYWPSQPVQIAQANF